MKEAAIRRGIRDFLRMVGFAVYDMEQNRRTRQTPGFPDLVALGHGRILFVEAKTPKGRLSVAQRAFREECETNGGQHHVWRSAQDAFKWFEAIEEENTERRAGAGASR